MYEIGVEGSKAIVGIRKAVRCPALNKEAPIWGLQQVVIMGVQGFHSGNRYLEIEVGDTSVFPQLVVGMISKGGVEADEQTIARSREVTHISG